MTSAYRRLRARVLRAADCVGAAREVGRASCLHLAPIVDFGSLSKAGPHGFGAMSAQSEPTRPLCELGQAGHGVLIAFTHQS